jgi:hypothetical protein
MGTCEGAGLASLRRRGRLGRRPHLLLQDGLLPGSKEVRV